MIDAMIGEKADNETKLKSIDEYAVESSINKVFCSESLDYVVDEMVQIYGGYGYSAEYPADRAYRDSRINRIFEGTNEINRMLIPGQLMKRAMKGKLPLIQAAKALQDEIMNPQMSFDDDDSLLALETKLAANAMETAVLRAKKLAAKGSADRQIDMAQVFCNDAIQKIEMSARNTIAGMLDGDEAKMLLVALKRFTKNNSPINTIAARQRIADTMISANKYVF
jgi:hypothetical protein